MSLKNADQMFALATLATLVWLVGTAPSGAQEFQQLAQTCDARVATSSANRIAACTTLIDSRSLTPHDEALGRMHRAWPQSLSGRLDLALADLNAAVELDPKSAVIWSDRGFTRLRLGQMREAIVDYTSALQLNPRTVYALYGRGLARLRLGDAGGSADLDAARGLQAGVDGVFAALGLRP